MRVLYLFVLVVVLSGCLEVNTPQGNTPVTKNNPGQREIRYGQNMDFSVQPEVGAMFVMSPKFPNEYYYYCTGTFIHSNVVLTAAHCVTEEIIYSIPAGLIYFSNRFSITKTRTDGRATLYSIPSADLIPVLQVRVHPEWDGTHGDLALLYLTRQGPAMTLPVLADDSIVVPNNSDIRAIGFGSDENGVVAVKRTAMIKYDRMTRDGIFMQMVPGANNAFGCPGDSGGPAYLSTGGSEYIIGIVSGGDTMNCAAAKTSAYTPVGRYKDWIEESLGLLDYPWHSKSHPFDTNNDGFIAALDVLVVINEINAHGMGSRDPARDPLPPLVPWYDISKENRVVPLDVLKIINDINVKGPRPIGFDAIFEMKSPNVYEVADAYQNNGGWSAVELVYSKMAKELDAKLRFRVSGRSYNWGRRGEKWVLSSKGYCYVTPDGKLWRYLNRKNRLGQVRGALVAEFPKSFYADPRKIYSPR